MYSPEIKPEKVQALYRLKLKTGRPMTELVDEAIARYLAAQAGMVCEGENAKEK